MARPRHCCCRWMLWYRCRYWCVFTGSGCFTVNQF